MFSFFQKIVIVLLFTLSLQAQNGLSQKYLLSVSPQESAQEVTADTTVEIKFSLPIVTSSLKKNSITLKGKNKKISGVTTIKNSNTLLFTPNEELVTGEYKVKIKKIKLQDSSYENLKGYKKFAHRLCSYFYDDISECPLCKYLCKVKSKKIQYTFSVDDTQPKVISLTLSTTNIELNEKNTTTIYVDAQYDNNETLDVTNEVEWVMSNSNIISIDKNIITPTNEGTTSLQASFKSQTTEEISVTVYKEINGYKLPPEPDPTINNSTLLGIDVNGNGVRDDVERKIIETYREPIKIELMMATSKIGQKILENPVGLAKENSDKMDRLDNCGSYLEDQNISYDGLESIRFYEKNIYNTKVRVRAYLDYNVALGGGVYGSSPADWVAESCDFDVDAMLGAR